MSDEVEIKELYRLAKKFFELEKGIETPYNMNAAIGLYLVRALNDINNTLGEIKARL